MSKVTKEELKSSTGANDANAEKFLPYINSALSKYSINNPKRILAFLSQIGHESNGLSATIEYASGDAYEGNTGLGNTQVGDGVRFKGRGLIQITGRYNYTNVSKALGVDFVSNPELLAQPQYAAAASAWWWNNKGLNQIADTMNLKKSLDDPENKQAFTKITLIINGGTRGLSQRGSNWEAGLQFIKDHPRAIALGITIIILALATGGYYWFNKDTIKADFKTN